ncbi:disease resistance protein PIK6-NP [Triticum aestivum]|uniref:disease resistance protein PIK6-NP n=1 Tax=Triticum aestivum TaxID=4565 RepID=UPI0003D48EB6|nr:disease resistance protein PIK6-NP-like [Triticum aestivum]
MLDAPDVQVKACISLVRELAYDIEDCVGKFIHQLGSGGGHGSFKDFFRKTARRLKTLGSRRGIANQINDLKARVKQVKELKSSYKLDDIAWCTSSDHAAVDPRLSALSAEEAHRVGIDGPRGDLAKWMMEGDRSTKRHRRVLSIFGFGGLGKTTLAHEVYRKIRGHYHCQAFVSVSQKPDKKRIIKDVI